MADLLKNVYNDHFFNIYTNALKAVVADFNLDQFMDFVRDVSWGIKRTETKNGSPYAAQWQTTSHSKSRKSYHNY